MVSIGRLGWVGEVGLAAGLAVGVGLGQDVGAAKATPDLPEITGLMHAVEVQQRAAELREKDYLYRQSVRMDDLDGHGGVKKTQAEVADIFWLEGVRVRRVVSKDGKELTGDQAKKESERIDKEVAKAKERRAKGDASGKETDSHGNEEVTVSRMLELGSFGNERRESVNGRDTIMVDFVGNPKAKTRNVGENAIHEMVGTIWVDEADRAIVRIDGHFVNNFKVGGGLLFNVKKDTKFSVTNVKVNDEVWLPKRITGDGEARAMLLFSLKGRLAVEDDGYRKFKATSTILPGVAEVPAVPSPQ
ncbi:hypothetical protein [Granulicella tundricola]|uniref:Uncharacterized protein n=1 Tax=Granulicella tundricola (strain ATCC BAA-1859 / DSM 23138 / MP5ACTX9) TaxID=1198114 RepID=E8WXW4_GRATM|nr:hypothetical protein [Granulicella tundricola]ADW69809.1 hypothetical protein AciX9_2786 [Granulicella tundricola MP5ACTX9]